MRDLKLYWIDSIYKEKVYGIRLFYTIFDFMQ